MGIVQLVTDVPGQIGDNPRRPKLITTDNLATITAAGYLNPSNLQGQVVLPTDVFDVYYSWVNASSPGTYSAFTVTMSNGVISLVQEVDPGNVLLPVVSNHFANFNGTNGQIKDAGYLPSNAALTRVVMQSGASVSGNLPKYNDVTGTLIDSGVAAANVVQSQSSVANNFVSFSVLKTLAFSQLSSAAKVNIVTHPSATAQFVVTDIKVLTSTGLSGGGGDRLLAVTDGTLVFNNAGITAALLGTPIFTIWGGTGNPIAVSSSQVSTAGADIYFQYTGGTTDYTAGSVQVIVTLVQVTA